MLIDNLGGQIAWSKAITCSWEKATLSETLSEYFFPGNSILQYILNRRSGTVYGFPTWHIYRESYADYFPKKKIVFKLHAMANRNFEYFEK